MKSLKSYINETYNYNGMFPQSKDELIEIINEIDPKEWKDIDVGNINDFSFLFENYKGEFGDISKWDVGNAINMEGMFMNSNFNGDISNWDVFLVENMRNMFKNSKFNGDLSKWDPGNLEHGKDMFKNCPLEKNTPIWWEEKYNK